MVVILTPIVLMVVGIPGYIHHTKPVESSSVFWWFFQPSKPCACFKSSGSVLMCCQVQALPALPKVSSCKAIKMLQDSMGLCGCFQK